MNRRAIVGTALGGTLVIFTLITMFLVTGMLGALMPAQCLTILSDPFNNTTQEGEASEAEAYFAQFSPGEREDRLNNARIIAETGEERGESARNITIAIAVAIQETNLKNYGHLGAFNDHDSCGVFQQQWTQGWGESCTQLMDVAFAATQFYNALDRLGNTDSMTMMEVGIAVQNPDPAAYKRRWAWDEIATQTAAMFVDMSGMQRGCYGGALLNGWRVPLDAGNYSVGDGFKWRWNQDLNAWRFHYGLDLGIGGGEPIYASGAGTIAFVGPLGTWGNQVRVDHGGGIETTYSHMSRFADVRVGDTVAAGQVIGYVGTTGRSTGNHLHLEVFKDGENVDPVKFFADLGIEF